MQRKWNLGWMLSAYVGCALAVMVSRTCEIQAAPFAIAAPPASEDNREFKPLITRVEAYAGRPFGVGKLSFRLRRGDELIDQTGATLLTERNHRVLYPVATRAAAARFFQALAGDVQGTPDSLHTIYFLFRGDEPLDLILHGDSAAQAQVPVEITRDRRFSRIVTGWWKEYLSVVDDHKRWGDYPPFVETYLASMLSRRLGLRLPPEPRLDRDPLFATLSLLVEVETLRSKTIEQAMTGRADMGPANLQMPPDVDWIPSNFGAFQGDGVEVEDIARAVPEECFYLRFGTWDNKVWITRLMSEYGGNLGRMVRLRGFESKIENKFLDQLVVPSSEIEEIFGGSVISDVAVIANDLYLEDGASIGVVLQAKSTKALKNRMLGKRASFAKQHRDEGVELTDIEVLGQTVQFLKSPDNRYRSFYVVMGDSHLTTTSLSMARRFIEAAGGKGSLATSREFLFARTEMPLDRDDTVFVFLPTRFLQNMLNPQYQIELARRNRSISDIQLVEMAHLAARAEQLPTVTTESLITNGFLPERFGLRPDGSQLTASEDEWIDSIRGRRGFFTPIPDLRITGVTAAEIKEFETKRRFYAERLPGLDPMFVAVKRYEHKTNVERVVFDGRIAPFGQDKHGWLLSMLGEPLREQVAPAPNDIIRFMLSLKGGVVNTKIPPHQIFAAIQDEIDPETDLTPMSFFKTLDMIKTAPGHVGSWPAAGYLDWLPNLGGQPDEYGYTQSRLLGLWRLYWDGFSVIAFDRERLEKLKTQLSIQPTERPAHARLDVGDLANSRIKSWVNVQNYRRSWQASIANVRLLNMLVQQFHLDADAARQVAEHLLDVNLVCSLDGKYVLEATPSGRLIWQSSQWPDFSNPELPEKYTAPMLKWFRGLQLELINGESQFVIHGYVDIARDPSEKLPSFKMFQGFTDLFSGDKKDEQK